MRTIPMSFLTDYFQNRKIKAREKNVAKFQKKACNKYGQQDERVRAIYYLRDLGDYGEFGEAGRRGEKIHLREFVGYGR